MLGLAKRTNSFTFGIQTVHEGSLRLDALLEWSAIPMESLDLLKPSPGVTVLCVLAKRRTIRVADLVGDTYEVVVDWSH